MAHTQPVPPEPNVKPGGFGTGIPANAVVDENTIDAASIAARIFDFFTAHLFPDSLYAAAKTISSFYR